MGKIHDLLKNLNKLGWTRRGNGEHNNTPCHSQRHRCIRRCPHKGGDRPGKKQRTAMAHDWDTETQRRQARQTGGQGVFPETEHQSGGLGTGEPSRDVKSIQTAPAPASRVHQGAEGSHSPQQHRGRSGAGGTAHGEVPGCLAGKGIQPSGCITTSGVAPERAVQEATTLKGGRKKE